MVWVVGCSGEFGEEGLCCERSSDRMDGRMDGLVSSAIYCSEAEQKERRSVLSSLSPVGSNDQSERVIRSNDQSERVQYMISPVVFSAHCLLLDQSSSVRLVSHFIHPTTPVNKMSSVSGSSSSSSRVGLNPALIAGLTVAVFVIVFIMRVVYPRYRLRYRGFHF